jgi:hypothetical protein
MTIDWRLVKEERDLSRIGLSSTTKLFAAMLAANSSRIEQSKIKTEGRTGFRIKCGMTEEITEEAWGLGKNNHEASNHNDKYCAGIAVHGGPGSR